MGWGLMRWMVSVRSVQLMGSFIPGALNGWLLYYIYSKRIGFAHSMIVLQILITLVFFYTLLSLLVMNGYKRSRRAAWMTGSIFFDVVFCFFAVAIVSILAYTGVPSNCSGLSKTIPVNPQDPSDKHLLEAGFNKIGFSNMSGANNGTLDQYCGMERAFYSIALCIILTYIITIILSVIRVCQLRMYTKDEVDGLLKEREDMINLEHKLQDQEAASTPTPAQNVSPVAPQSNGGFAATNTRSNTHHSPVSRTTHHTTPSSSNRPARPGLRYADPMPGPSSSSSASSYRARQPAEPVSPLSPDSPISSTAPLPHDRGFILSATDVSANLAMVADGSRYTPHQHQYQHQQADHNQLPPYSPGNNMRATMHGHGGESNDIRLSEYVKGATAAQDMKDSNGF
ncbi:hypothetical protein LA080_011452 [Diaporthe eres]|uniref:MARVEL domain-containing protein n=2 Tax=Diaporthe vaccinii TaxID=105482 RepID=A0ABR4EMK8_9PEZI|nr:hypothetical protein LA080_011452 [Diaporthe eres]